MIGNDSKNVLLKGTKAMVRIGGGFEDLESYVLGHQDDELAQMGRQMESQGDNWDDVVVANLKKYKTD